VWFALDSFCWNRSFSVALQWIDVTGRGIDDIHNEMHQVVAEVIRNVGNRELGQLWTDDIDQLRTVNGS